MVGLCTCMPFIMASAAAAAASSVSQSRAHVTPTADYSIKISTNLVLTASPSDRKQSPCDKTNKNVLHTTTALESATNHETASNPTPEPPFPHAPFRDPLCHLLTQSRFQRRSTYNSLHYLDSTSIQPSRPLDLIRSEATTRSLNAMARLQSRCQNMTHQFLDWSDAMGHVEVVI